MGLKKGEPNTSYRKIEDKKGHGFVGVWMDLILIDFHVMSVFMLDVTAGNRITINW